jgi:translocation and assembly module TamB
LTEFPAPGGVPTAPRGGTWRITLTASGPQDDLRIALSSEPALNPDDIALLLTVGLTRAEVDAMRATPGALQGGIGLEALAALGGAERVVRGILPVDDFRFGSEYSPKTLRMVPDVMLRKRIGDRLSATVTTGLLEERDVRGSLSWQIDRRAWLELLWENVAVVPALPVGDLGLGLRWRVELR